MGATKACRDCGELKPLELYPLQRRNRDGRSNQCRACASAYSRRYRKATGHGEEMRRLRRLTPLPPRRDCLPRPPWLEGRIAELAARAERGEELFPGRRVG